MCEEVSEYSKVGVRATAITWRGWEREGGEPAPRRLGQSRAARSRARTPRANSAPAPRWVITERVRHRTPRRPHGVSAPTYPAVGAAGAATATATARAAAAPPITPSAPARTPAGWRPLEPVPHLEAARLRQRSVPIPYRRHPGSARALSPRRHTSASYSWLMLPRGVREPWKKRKCASANIKTNFSVDRGLFVSITRPFTSGQRRVLYRSSFASPDVDPAPRRWSLVLFKNPRIFFKYW